MGRQISVSLLSFVFALYSGYKNGGKLYREKLLSSVSFCEIGFPLILIQLSLDFLEVLDIDIALYVSLS